MKRNILKLLAASFAVFAATLSCKDMRDNYMVDDTFGFAHNDVNTELTYAPLVNISLLNEQFDISIMKSGKGNLAGTVLLSVSEVALAEYNEQNGTNYQLMPSNLYELGTTRYTFARDDYRKYIDIKWDDAAIFNLLEGGQEYVVPLMLSVADESVPLDKARSNILIYPRQSFISIAPPADSPATPAAEGIGVYKGDISIDFPVKVMDIEVGYEIDYDLIDTYNLENNTHYLAPPPTLTVSLGAESSTISKGKLSTPFEIQIASTGLFNAADELIAVDNNPYMIPVRITGISNELIKTEGDIVYVPLTLNKELKGPWEILEGNELALAMDPVPPTDEASQLFTASYLVDGIVSADRDFRSWFNTMNEFPATFVIDMGRMHVFTEFRVATPQSYIPSARKLEFYLAEEYNGPDTEWTLVASGERPEEWTPLTFYGKEYYPMVKMIKGRYLKFRVMEHGLPGSTTGDWANKRWRLADVQGMGF